MPSKQVAGTKLSRLMGWESAVAACNEIWDAFETEFAKEIDKKIEALESEIQGQPIDFDEVPDVTVYNRKFDLLARQASLKQCKIEVPRTFQAWRRTELEQMERGLFVQRSKPSKVGPVYTRGKVPLTLGGKPIKRRKKKKVVLGAGKKVKKRPHRKTGRKRGRPVRALFDPGSVNARRDKNRAQRREFRAVHRANNIVRALRGLRPYPFRRLPKVEGWEQSFRDAKLWKGTGGKYQHGPKRGAQL